ncbi:MAG: BolA/IbaG family iron-sulfur metabolism protein [Gammaproteobacteria bacterium]|nr:BolA/IbaG family iron-sulfur metabolism protein [Gammaproteobacteria bacterium]MDH3769259.1 BolA/IbaG family iron-sulfur metabolism protein [Gammaproteobacteria bacterium]
MDPVEVEALIRVAMPDATISVRSPDGRHFEALVISEVFDGKRTITRHRAVYDALGELVGREIHALSLRTLTPSEADAE